MKTEELLTIQKITNLLNISEDEVRALIKNKALPKVYDTYYGVEYWKKSDIDNYLKTKHKTGD